MKKAAWIGLWVLLVAAVLLVPAARARAARLAGNGAVLPLGSRLRPSLADDRDGGDAGGGILRDSCAAPGTGNALTLSRRVPRMQECFRTKRRRG